MKLKKKRRLELIRWIDAATDDRWFSAYGIRQYCRKARRTEVASVGFVIAEGKHEVIMAQGIEKEEGCCLGMARIPKGCILKRQRLQS